MTDESPFDNTPARLPSRWELIVQLVGTFGLAVFLVLYYVLVMQPREQARYEELRLSVDAVLQMVEAGQTFVTREQSERLKELFILSAAPELAKQIEQVLPGGVSVRPVPVAEAGRLTAKLRDNLEDVLIVRTRLLQGLVRKGGGDLSESFVVRIRKSEVADRLAVRVVTEWPYRARHELVDVCEETLHTTVRTLSPTR